jgi:hypothetical protein
MYAIAPTPVIQNADPLAARKIIARILTRIISRAYGSIDQIVSIDIADDGLITCLFRDDDKDRKLIRLVLGDRAEYRQILDGRNDSLNIDTDQYLVAYANSIGQRTDKVSKPNNCKIGTSCKGACISKTDVCRVDVPEVLNRQEISDLNDAVNDVQRAKFVGVAPVSDELDSKNIRELKDEARKRGVYRYSYMNQSQLRESIRLQQANPERQNIVREGLSRNAASKKALKSLLPQPVAGAWKDIEKISKFFGDNRPAAGVLAASVLLGIPSSVMLSARDRYKEGLPESALMAYQRSQTTPVEPTSKPQITFAVGGFSNLGSSGSKVAEYLKTPLDTSKREQWFNKTQEIIAFDSPEFNVPPTKIDKKDKDGKYNPLYLGYVAKESFGKYLSNVVGGRNEAAVDLASKLYAYGSKYRNKPLNVVSYGSGGNVIDEAAEIVSRIKPEKGLDGREILKRLNIARLGGASFGLTGGTTQDEKNWASINNRTITSKNDPFSILPKRFSQFVSSVKGGEIEDYLTNSDARDKIREVFGFFSNSAAGSKITNEASDEIKKSLKDVAKTINPKLGKLANLIDGISSKYSNNPVAAAIDTAGALAVTGVAVVAKSKLNYKENLGNSASKAQEMVSSGQVSPISISKPNVIITVGDAEIDGDEMKRKIEGAKQSSGRGLVANNYLNNSEVIAFDRPFLTPPSRNKFMAPVDLMAKTYEAVMNRTLAAGTDPEAIRLAANIYAIANTPYAGTANSYPSVSVVGLKQGGETTKRALDILEKMTKVQVGAKADPNIVGGRSVSSGQVHIITLGTPELDFGGKGANAARNDLWVDGDIFGQTPLKGSAPSYISTQGNGSASDYLEAPVVADLLGKLSSTSFARAKKNRRQ